MSDKDQHRHISSADVDRLLSDRSTESVARTAVRVAKEFNSGRLTEAEREIAERIIEKMAADAELMVRAALAESLKSSPALPPAVAMQMAQDVAVVALPVLQFSQVLTEEELIELVKAGEPAKQKAIASRPIVSTRLADAVIDHGDVGAVSALAGNEGAAISDSGFHRMVDRFGDDPRLHEPLVQRARLPITVAERLVSLVSDQMQTELAARHELPGDMTTDLIIQGREKAIMTLAGTARDQGALDRLTAQLEACGRLTPSLMLRALCLGDVPFFESAVAARLKAPVANVRILIHDAGPLGLKSVVEKARLPKSFLPALKVALDVAEDTEFLGEDGDLERHRRLMIERILTQFDGLEEPDLDYLLGKLSDLSPIVSDMIREQDTGPRAARG